MSTFEKPKKGEVPSLTPTGEAERLKAFLAQAQEVFRTLGLSTVQEQQFVHGLSPIFVQGFDTIKVHQRHSEDITNNLKKLSVEGQSPLVLIHNASERMKMAESTTPRLLSIELFEFPSLVGELRRNSKGNLAIAPRVEMIRTAVLSPDSLGKPRVLLLHDDIEKLRDSLTYMRSCSLLIGDEQLEREYAARIFPMVTVQTERLVTFRFPHVNLIKEQIVEREPNEAEVLELLDFYRSSTALLFSCESTPNEIGKRILYIPPLNEEKIPPIVDLPFELNFPSAETSSGEKEKISFDGITAFGLDCFLECLSAVFTSEKVFNEAAFFEWESLSETQKIIRLTKHPSHAARKLLEYYDRNELPCTLSELAEILKETIVTSN